ncbi:IS30 family transposase [Paenibacillus xylanexedens]|uniref:IS30 family transposase n=1 Tax=Paenibacillus xylanexedens TaxID=528191 RepID=UPI0021B290AE|nr:IS30 family transposase [Paenibacillus xylanexedens]
MSFGRGVLTVLRHKGERQKPSETCGKFAVGKTISLRPKEVRSQKTTVVSNRGKSKGCLATFIERKTRLYTAIQMPDRTALSTEIAFGVAASQCSARVFQTTTADRGKEFACYLSLEATHDLQVYFAVPYSSWQRGSNENANGSYESFSPRGRISHKSQMKLYRLLYILINHRPRKCLGWRTAQESLIEELSHLA